MALSLLSTLTASGVLERCSGRRGAFLRVTPRFLAHAESTAARLRMGGRLAQPETVLAAALLAWDDYRADATHGSRLLLELLEERGQLGSLRPAFPVLEQFTPLAAA